MILGNLSSEWRLLSAREVVEDPSIQSEHVNNLERYITNVPKYVYQPYWIVYVFYNYMYVQYVIWVRKFRKNSGNNIWYPWKILLFDLGISQINRFFRQLQWNARKPKKNAPKPSFRVFNLIEMYFDELQYL